MTLTLAPLLFGLLMMVVFQSIFTWSKPVMKLFETGFGWLGDWVGAHMAEGALKSLICDGVIAGVGGVIGRRPHLPHQREHIRRELHIEDVRFVDLAGCGMGCRFVEDGGKTVEVLREHRNGYCVHRNWH